LHVKSEIMIDQLSAECIRDCTQPGQAADAPVQHWRELLDFTVDRDNAIKCLSGYGAWENLDQETDNDLAERILWLTCCNFAEYDGTEDSPCGSDIFILE